MQSAEYKQLWKPQPAERCPGCYLTPAECVPGEQLLETIPGWVQCPRCPGGFLEELDAESTEDELRRAIRECQANKQSNAGKGSSSGSKGRKKEQRYSGASRAEQEAMAFLGRVPEQMVTGVEKLGSVSIDAKVSILADAYLQAASHRLGQTIAMLLKGFALRAIYSREPIDTEISAKEKKIDVRKFSLGEQEGTYLSAMAKSYGLGVGTLMFFIIEEQRRGYEQK